MARAAKREAEAGRQQAEARVYVQCY
jgi:hypothetical protein